METTLACWLSATQFRRHAWVQFLKMELPCESGAFSGVVSERFRGGGFGEEVSGRFRGGFEEVWGKFRGGFGETNEQNQHTKPTNGTHRNK